MWSDILVALALVLVIEGITPFLSPRAYRQALQVVNQFSDQALRLIGLVAMLCGALLLYLVRHN